VHMPLVRTPMIAPTRLYEHVPVLTPEQAAELVVDAVVRRPARVATRLGLLGQAVGLLAPRLGQIVLNTGYRMFPDSAASRGVAEEGEAPSADQVAFTQLLRGLHL
jgi:hypothetical protein